MVDHGRWWRGGSYGVCTRGLLCGSPSFLPDLIPVEYDALALSLSVPCTSPRDSLALALLVPEVPFGPGSLL